MKKLLMVLLLISTPILAEDKPLVPPETAQALRKIVNVLDGATPDPRATPNPDHKTLADVADKALDITTAAVTKIAGQMEQVAPQVWRMFIVQQYVKAVQDLIWPAGTIVLVVLLDITLCHFWKEPKDKQEEWEVRFLSTKIIPGLVCLIYGGIFIANLSGSIGLFINPQYYAVKDILHLILAPSSM